MPTESQCSDRRDAIWGGIGRRVRWSVFVWIVGCIIAIGASLVGVLYAATIRNSERAERAEAIACDRADKAMDKARNNEARLARIDQQTKENGRGIERVEDLLKDMRANK